MAALRKPKTNVFRTFLYINRAEVIDSLSALEVAMSKKFSPALPKRAAQTSAAS
jgi:hypothetical protein